MKTLLKFFIPLFLFTCNCYASDKNEISSDIDNPEFMEDEYYDYEGSTTETRERSEYNIDMKNYVSVQYISTKTVIEHK